MEDDRKSNWEHKGGGVKARAVEEESTEVEDRGEESADKVGTRGAGDVRSTRV